MKKNGDFSGRVFVIDGGVQADDPDPDKTKRERPSRSPLGHAHAIVKRIGMLKVAAAIVGVIFSAGVSFALLSAKAATKDYVDSTVDEQLKQGMQLHEASGHPERMRSLQKLERDVAALKATTDDLKSSFDRFDARQVRIEDKIDRLVDDPSPRRRRNP